MTVSSPNLAEGSSEPIMVSIVSSDGSTPGLTTDLSIDLGTDTGSVAGLSDESISSSVILPAMQNSIPVTLYALSDRVLERDELLILKASHPILGSVDASLTITDMTSKDPNNKVITIGNGTIYYNESITITAQLPDGVTTDSDIEVVLSVDPGSSLSNVPMPRFPNKVIIPKDGGSVQFTVSGSSNSDTPAKLILAGATTGDFKVKPGTITILNKRVVEFMSISVNEDNIHEYSTIDNIEKFPNNEVDIIDRWGVLVWQGKSYNNADIAFKGKSNQGRVYDLPDGTYYYVIRFYDEKGELNIVKGSLQLKRGTAN
jgi:gliding motility-associated-like protein